jgi:hypothetical protein
MKSLEMLNLDKNHIIELPSTVRISLPLSHLRLATHLFSFGVSISYRSESVGHFTFFR